ncbi:hypothetical protein OUZ56_007932 [Daphnia magna]|uniref:Uncharacterized protein n=1 Tax=Daphnia magna TaxID=35525 RepID=A0ABR0ABF2_9CRUS|nr:hypothetical protein OUZ56_007932 [Daphnia magna]
MAVSAGANIHQEPSSALPRVGEAGRWEEKRAAAQNRVLSSNHSHPHWYEGAGANEMDERQRKGRPRGGLPHALKGDVPSDISPHRKKTINTNKFTNLDGNDFRGEKIDRRLQMGLREKRERERERKIGVKSSEERLRNALEKTVCTGGTRSLQSIGIEKRSSAERARASPASYPPSKPPKNAKQSGWLIKIETGR